MGTAKDRGVERRFTKRKSGNIRCELYHLTKKEYLEDIMHQGIKPGKGANSLIAEELEQPTVFLCKAADVPKWQVLLDADTVIRVSPLAWDELFGIDSEDPKAKVFHYTGYEEVRCTCHIPPQYLGKALPRKQAQLDKANHDLALSYTYSLCVLCAQILNMDYAEKNEEYEIPEEDVKELTEIVNGITAVCERIDFTKASADEYAKLLTKESLEECAYTFADYYFGEGMRCFEYLPEIQGPLSEPAKQLFACIVKKYPKEALYVKKIGGYCK